MDDSISLRDPSAVLELPALSPDKIREAFEIAARSSMFQATDFA